MFCWDARRLLPESLLDLEDITLPLFYLESCIIMTDWFLQVVEAAIEISSSWLVPVSISLVDHCILRILCIIAGASLPYQLNTQYWAPPSYQLQGQFAPMPTYDSSAMSTIAGSNVPPPAYSTTTASAQIDQPYKIWKCEWCVHRTSSLWNETHLERGIRVKVIKIRNRFIRYPTDFGESVDV